MTGPTGKPMDQDSIRGYAGATLSGVVEGEIERYIHAVDYLLQIEAVYASPLGRPRINLLYFLSNYATAAGWPEGEDHIGDLAHLSDDDIEELCGEVILDALYRPAASIVRRWRGF